MTTSLRGNAAPWETAARRRRLLSSSERWGLAFIAPFFIVLAVTLIIPVAYAFYLSLFQNKMIGGLSFVGFDNYIKAFGDTAFHGALLNVVLLLVLHVPLMLIIATMAALALDSARLWAASFFRISIFLPHAVPSVVVVLMWGFIYGVNFGIVANLNDFFGWEIPNPVRGLAVYPALANLLTWESIGYSMLVMFSALVSVPRELYEAARVDGASRRQITWHIKLPAIRSAIVVATMFSVIGTLQLFNSPNILRDSGTSTISSSFTPNMYAYTLSFAGQNINYAAAIAIIAGMITAAVAYAVRFGGDQENR